MRLLAWLLPHHHVVRTMDHDGEVRYALAQGEWGQVLHAHMHWATELGGMHLHPNGLVTGVSYVYFWEPVDQDALSVMHLTYDCKDWHKLQHAGWR